MVKNIVKIAINVLKGIVIRLPIELVVFGELTLKGVLEGTVTVCVFQPFDSPVNTQPARYPSLLL